MNSGPNLEPDFSAGVGGAGARGAKGGQGETPCCSRALGTQASAGAVALWLGTGSGERGGHGRRRGIAGLQRGILVEASPSVKGKATKGKLSHAGLRTTPRNRLRDLCEKEGRRLATCIVLAGRDLRVKGLLGASVASIFLFLHAVKERFSRVVRQPSGLYSLNITLLCLV